MHTLPTLSRTLAALTFSLAGLAMAQTTAPASAPRADGPAMEHRGGPGHHGPRHGGPGMQGRQGHHGAQGGGLGRLFLGPGMERMLDVANANPQQRADIRRIAGAARDDLRAARRQAADPAQRQAWLNAWAGDQVDASALERERQRMAAQRDAMGRRMVQAMVDIGAVLKPEQRKAVAEHLRSMRPAQRRAELDLDFDMEAHGAVAAD